MKTLLTCFLVLGGAFVLRGQVVHENNPPSLKWDQINTGNFRIVFPRGFQVQAQRVANTLEHIREPEAMSMGKSAPRKISVILQNQSSISNGFVSVLPRRSEFFTMPSQDYNFMGTNDWLDLLASHEYRHIVQYRHARRGFNNVLYYLFGGATFAGMAQVAAPEWFWEGDAVAAETAFTPAGRGKIPNFALAFKTNLLEGREFNYHKQLLRSYKHHIPDEYVLGYHMISYLRKRTGDPDIWARISGRSWSVPFIPFAFSNAIKKEAGLYVTDLYREMVSDFQAQWKDRVAGLELTPFQVVSTRKSKAYTDYLYPQVLDDGSVLAMKVGIGDIPQFVVIRDGGEKTVFTPGPVNDAGMLSAAGGRIVWNEYGFDPRWLVRNYSLVKSFDLESGKRRVIGSRRDRLAGAALSPDGTLVATVRTTTGYETRLLVLDHETDTVAREFSNPANDFFSMPRWSPDGHTIAALKTSDGSRTITLFNVDDGTQRDLLPPSNENIGHPLPVEGFVLYNSPVTGIDNIFALKIATGETFQVTNSRYGAYNPALSNDGKTLYYNDQGKNGLDVVRTAFDPSQWKPFVRNGEGAGSYQHLVEQEGNPGLFDNVPTTVYPVTRYSKLKGLINPYTWGLNVESDLTEAQIGISSRDILSTTSINAGYAFDINERTGAWRAQVSYQGWYPIIDLSGSFAERSVDEGELRYSRIVNEDTATFISNLNFDWKEKNIRGGLRLPLLLTNGKFSTRVTFANHINFTQVYDFRNSLDGGGRIITADFPQYIFRGYADNGRLIHNHFAVDFTRLLRRSRRDIHSKWGQALYLDALTTTGSSDFAGAQFSVYGLAYFPGLFKHHSLWGYWAYQHTKMDWPEGEGSKGYWFRNLVPLPRGQSLRRFQDLYSMSANYTMPVWYPDIAMGPVLNIQRIRSNFFLDYALGSTNIPAPGSMTYLSAGLEVKADLNIMRFYPQFDIGVRFTRGLDPSLSEFEILIGTFNF